MRRFVNILAGLSLGLWGVACDSHSFSLSSVSNQFSQSVSVNNKVDIVWVVDGSGTMANHQENLAQNFAGFIEQFRDKGFDFHMVVASTDGWVRELNYNAASCYLFNLPGHSWYSPEGPNPGEDPDEIYISSADCQPTLATWQELTEFRDGDIYGAVDGTPGERSGKYLITSEMEDDELYEVFKTNVKTGVRGDGVREATLQSLRATLRRNSDGSVGYGGETHTVLDQFRRPDAFLAVIAITDEEDQSRRQEDDSPYESAQAYVEDFTKFLDGYTGVSHPGNRRYSVSGIVLKDINSCPYDLHDQVSEGHFHIALAEATRGVVGNICDSDFYQDLENIAETVITLATRFPLSGPPSSGTLVVTVNGVEVPESDTNGWTYVNDQGGHYIEFHGESVPGEDAVIAVDFTPAGLL